MRKQKKKQKKTKNYPISNAVQAIVSHQMKHVSELADRYSGSVIECPLCDREVAGSIPGPVIPKTLKMVLAAFLLGAQH